MRSLITTGEVIDALGGTAKCARLLGHLELAADAELPA
jgi:hypothetical protein